MDKLIWVVRNLEGLALVGLALSLWPLIANYTFMHSVLTACATGIWAGMNLCVKVLERHRK